MKKIVLVFSFLAIVSCGSSTPDESDAKQAARAAIIQNLKNPLDLKFHQNETVENLGDNTFLYKESVNAKNSFGGAIAQNVTTKVKWISGDPSEPSSWSVIDISFEDR